MHSIVTFKCIVSFLICKEKQYLHWCAGEYTCKRNWACVIVQETTRLYSETNRWSEANGSRQVQKKVKKKRARAIFRLNFLRTNDSISVLVEICFNPQMQQRRTFVSYLWNHGIDVPLDWILELSLLFCTRSIGREKSVASKRISAAQRYNRCQDLEKKCERKREENLLLYVSWMVYIVYGSVCSAKSAAHSILCM